jgi:lipoyl(octanoyl) transferase
LNKQTVIFKDLGIIGYKDAWDFQEKRLTENLDLKTIARNSLIEDPFEIPTQHHLLFCEHPPVYTLGKSGNPDHVLLNDNGLTHLIHHGLSVGTIDRYLLLLT